MTLAKAKDISTLKNQHISTFTGGRWWMMLLSLLLLVIPMLLLVAIPSHVFAQSSAYLSGFIAGNMDLRADSINPDPSTVCIGQGYTEVQGQDYLDCIQGYVDGANGNCANINGLTSNYECR